MITYRHILSLAIPSIIANITTPLLSLADTAIAGHLGDATYLAAIAVGGSMFNMIYFLFAFLRMGTSGRTAQAFGAGDVAEQSRVLARSLLTAAVFSTVIIALHPIIGKAGMAVLDPDAETEARALTYFNILIFGAPAVLMNYSIYGWLIGMQRSKDTMVISLCVNIINICVSCFLVYVLGTGIEGIATGTLAAQWAGALAGYFYIRRNGFRMPPSNGFFAPYKLEKRHSSVNIDIFLRTLCLVGVTVWFTRTGASQGAVMLAVNSLLMQFFVLFSYFMDGFAFAGEALAGRFLGSGEYRLLRETVSKLVRLGAVVAALFTLGYLILGDTALGLLTDDVRVRSVAADYRIWILTIPFAGFMAFMMDGVFVGMTRTRHMLESLIIAAAVFFGVLRFAPASLGNNSLWLAFTLYLLARGIFLYAMYRTRIFCRIGKNQ